MAEISSENIITLFCRITGESSDSFKYSDLTDSAKAKIEGLLNTTNLSDIQISDCEYAAAADAAYMYACEGRNLFLTESGGAFSEYGYGIEEADRLRHEALGRICDIIADNEFVFAAFSEDEPADEED